MIRPMSSAMTEMTTSSSISVKPSRRRCGEITDTGRPPGRSTELDHLPGDFHVQPAVGADGRGGQIQAQVLDLRQRGVEDQHVVERLARRDAGAGRLAL